MNDQMLSSSQQYETIKNAIQFIRTHSQRQPTLKEISTAVNLSECHLQRVFTAWAGVSPKRFLQFVTKEHALQALKQSRDVLNVALDTGLSGAGRLHDLIVTCEAMTPGEIKRNGRDLVIDYGRTVTPFGEAILGWTQRGICHLEFCDADFEQKQAALISTWASATLIRNDQQAEDMSNRIFSGNKQAGKLHLVVRGTNFQLKVWQALLKTSSSQVLSYSQLARLSGSPKAQRAVGSALAANTIGYLIPCHRVIRESGETGVYRWGEQRKVALQAWEAAIVN